jgi:hypothetical protein
MGKPTEPAVGALSPSFINVGTMPKVKLAFVILLFVANIAGFARGFAPFMSKQARPSTSLQMGLFDAINKAFSNEEVRRWAMSH